MTYFIYSSETGFKEYDSLEEALKNGNQCIDLFLDETWNEEVESLVVGMITHTTEKCDVKEKPDLDEDGLDEDGEPWPGDVDYACNYSLIPQPTQQHTESLLKSNAVSEFVNNMIGALESGFVEENTLTLAQLHRVMQHHCKDNYQVEIPDISDLWGSDVAKLCGSNH